MKSILFCTSYFADREQWDSRYLKWLEYYQSIPIDCDGIYLVDDASPYIPDASVVGLSCAEAGGGETDGRPQIVRFESRLGRSADLVYPGWWRSFFHSLTLARQVGAKKIIHIESDAYVISGRMLDYINSIESGWTVFWCASYEMPETAIQVICEDQFDIMENLAAKGSGEFDGHLAERILPFTSINKDFLGDRYGEFKIPILRSGILKSRKFNTLKIFQGDRFRQPIPKFADFATQVTPDQKFSFQGT